MGETESILHKELNELRRKLGELLSDSSDLTNPVVVSVSQQMDAIVLHLQKAKMYRQPLLAADTQK